MATKLHKEGVTFIADLARDNVVTPASYYLRLANDENLADTDGLADVTECDAPGYAAQAVASDTTDLTLSDFGTNDVQLETSSKTFDFTAAGDTVNMWYLATTLDNSGKLIASGSLDTPHTPSEGSDVTVSGIIQLTSPVTSGARWHKEGLTFLANLLRDNTTTPASYYLRVANDLNLDDTDGLVDVEECNADGYTAQAVASDTTDLVLTDYGTNDVKLTASEETFSFTGAGDAINMGYLATTSDNTGKLLASGPLTGAPLTPHNGATVKVIFVLPLSTP